MRMRVCYKRSRCFDPDPYAASMMGIPKAISLELVAYCCEVGIIFGNKRQLVGIIFGNQLELYLAYCC